MRLVGCLLLLSGWLIALSAMVMLTSLPQRVVFVLAGLSVEGLGLILLTRAYRSMQRRQP